MSQRDIHFSKLNDLEVKTERFVAKDLRPQSAGTAVSHNSRTYIHFKISASGLFLKYS